MLSSKFYHSKTSPYPSRLIDDYNYHHNDMHRGSSRPYSSSKYYNDSFKPRVPSSSTTSSSGSGKFDLRHQLNKNYYANQYEESKRDDVDRSDSEDSRKSRTSPVNGQSQRQQQIVKHVSGSTRLEQKSDDWRSVFFLLDFEWIQIIWSITWTVRNKYLSGWVWSINNVGRKKVTSRRW